MTQCQYLTLLSVEVHVATRSDLRPDPEFDEIRAVFYSLHIDQPATAVGGATESRDTVGGARVSRDVDSDGVIVVSSDKLPLLSMTGVSGGHLSVSYVDSEIELLSALSALVIRFVQRLQEQFLLQDTTITTARYYYYYTVSPKNIPDIFNCNIKTTYQISIFFCTNIPDTTCH